MVGRMVIAALVLVGVVTACGDDDTASPSTTATSIPSATTIATTTAAPTTAAPTTAAPTTGAPTTTAMTTSAPTTSAPTTTAPTTVAPTMATIAPGMTQPAVWPGPGTGFDTPEAAATDFIEQVLGVEALLGEFQSGDAMSGEIEVLSPLDDDDPATTASTGEILLLRRIVPDGSWFVLAAASDGVTIESPVAHTEVAPGLVEVSGVGRGFEGTLVVRAFVAGDATTEFDLEIAATDWQTPMPYSVTLDLGAAQPGEMVAIVARGDTGIAAAGEFAAIPIVIAG